ncbi:MAG: DUF2155 domain-containing protein [Alphaproteobacteria bacterium]|nr:DUF2155 domain-containing protein [Alphaproteobacteria bacterium]
MAETEAINTPKNTDKIPQEIEIPVPQNKVAQKLDHVKLRILDKVTGEYSTFKFTEKKSYALHKNIKVCVKNMYTQRVTPSMDITLIFVEVWEKNEDSDLGNEWALLFSNWLSNLHNTFMHDKWHLHICD